MSLAEWHRRYLHQSHWTEAVRRHLFNRIHLDTSDRILEVGSGTGAVLGQIARELPCSVIGIDIDAESLLFSQVINATFILTQADAHRLPFPDKFFSITYCHYLLMWVESPLDVLVEMRRVTQPGGVVLALAEPDYPARIDFPPPLDRMGQFQNQALKAQGADIQMGRNLGKLFYESGLSNIEMGILGARWRPKSAEDIDQTEWNTLRSDLSDVLTRDKLAVFEKTDRQAREHAQRVLFIPTFYAAGIV